MELELTDNATHRTGALDQEVIVRLPERPGTGFVWRLDQTDAWQVVHDDFEGEVMPRGASGMRVLTIRAVRAGTAVLRLVEARTPTGPPHRVFSVEVDVRPG